MARKSRKKEKAVQAEENTEVVVQEEVEASFEAEGISEEEVLAALSADEAGERAFDSELIEDFDEDDEDDSDDVELDDESFDDEHDDDDDFQLETQEDVDQDEPVAPRRSGLLRFEEALTLEGQIEALIFAAPKALHPDEILEIVQTDDMAYTTEDIEGVLNSLVTLYKERNGGFRLEQVKGCYQFQTVAAAAPLMERLFSSRPRPLSRAALETLAIIAYRQPVTRADVEFIRGVDAGSIIKNLLERNLIACVGRKEDSGRPMLFGTTAYFLEVFRLNAIQDLPPLSAFQPAQETMAEAMNKLENEEAVDVEGFIADREDKPLSDEETELLAQDGEVEDGEGSGFVFAADDESVSEEETDETSDDESEEESFEGEESCEEVDEEVLEAASTETEEHAEVTAEESSDQEEHQPANSDDPFWELEMMEKKSKSSRSLKGASAKSEESDSDEDIGTDANSEVDIPAGSGFPPRGGKVDFGGTDID